MTHAIYIAVILVLAGVACWLWRERERLAAACGRANAARAEADYWKAAAESSESYYRIATQIGNETQDQLDQCQASNRSLRGWNGRYRRRIAELEAELADVMGDEA